MKRVRSLTIAGIPTSITWTREEMPEDCRGVDFGHTDVGRRQINVDAEFCGSEMSTEMTTLHECIHAVLTYTGHAELLTKIGEKEEEALVLALEHSLYPAICQMVAAGAFRPRGRRN